MKSGFHLRPKYNPITSPEEDIYISFDRRSGIEEDDYVDTLVSEIIETSTNPVITQD